MENLEKSISELKKEVKLLKLQQKNRAKRLKNLFKYALISCMFSASVFTFAQVIASLHLFNDGDIISAQKINENFQYLESKINNFATSGFVTETIAPQQSRVLTDLDNGKLFVFQGTGTLILPSIATVSPGYSFKANLFVGSQVAIQVAPGDKYSSYTDDLLVLSANYSSAYFEYISTGTEWINTISSGGNYNVINSAKVYLATACTGKGSGNTNCYQNTTAMNTTSYGYTKINDYYFMYNSYDNRWEKLGFYDYLINDPTNSVTETFTKSYELGGSEVKSVSGTIYALGRSTYNIQSFFNYNAANPQIHAGGIVQDYVNTFITGNLYDSNTGNYLGSNCQYLFGPKWKHITEAEVTAAGISESVEFWTGTTGTAANYFIYIDTMGAAQEAMYSNNYVMACVYTP